MRVLVVGSGGREHALVWKLFQSERVARIYAAPGNDGMLPLADRVDIGSDDITGLANWAVAHHIDLTVVGPEDPLVAGIVDEFNKRGLAIFGPSKKAAMVEGSKVYAKEILKKYNIPTAEYEVFTNPHEALQYFQHCVYPVVIKAEGLAGGKGVVIATNKSEAEKAVAKIMEERIFGDAGNRIVVEDFLEGEEVSILVLTDGKNILPLSPAQDYKAIFDGDEGPNTGGMGAYSPTPFIDDVLQEEICHKILKPTIKAFQAEGINYKGILYAGLIITDMGPKVLDFNTRLGDPETQVILPRLKNDLINLIEMVVNDNLEEIKLEWDKRSAVCVVLVSGGYPIDYKSGYLIEGLNELNKYDNVLVFHAGTKKEGDDFYTAGGRVLGITVLGSGLIDAIDQVYECIDQISFEDMHYRTDIAYRVFDDSY
ncbi:phosphoribosylamine--glycine ligase [Iocasia frigidifontis]|uniref:Phosphoribosylamine--glycine ligase n=1 Tax=Iocasia fonsfrigidae TaxID=2682810 RepID=A0A8A7KE78_9FIRM|nr:phosphoribosylamine--glycine ligase [Halocella sp. SP3-1]QTM00107.1 phosphoribosylamine--glycine ligase [Iocasia fonsfrigidae]